MLHDLLDIARVIGLFLFGVLLVITGWCIVLRYIYWLNWGLDK